MIDNFKRTDFKVEAPGEVAPLGRPYPSVLDVYSAGRCASSRIFINKHLHRSGEVLESVAEFGDMADSGPREMIAKERDPISGKHIEHPHARVGSLFGVRIVDKLEARLQHQQDLMMREIADYS